MEKICVYILSLSYKSVFIIFIAMIARLIMKKSPKIFSYVLWSVVFVRLIIPFGIQVDFNMKDGKNTISRYIPSTFLQNDMELSNIEYKNEKITVKPEGTTNLGKGNSSEASGNNFRVKGYIVRLLSCVWWSGVILLLTLSIISYFKMKGLLKKSKHIKDNIYLCSDIETPFVFGIINPNIYIPYEFTEDEECYIIEHENAHIKRFDYIIKIVCYFIACVHWFNPLVWISFNMMESDMELSCDEMVLKKMGVGIKKKYSTCLLNVSTRKRRNPFCPVAFSESSPEKRIKNVLKYKGRSKRVIITMIIFVMVVMLMMFMEPKVNSVVVTSKDIGSVIGKNDVSSVEVNITENKSDVKSNKLLHSYNLYFNDQNAEYLIPERRDIEGSDPKQVLGELFKGAESKELTCLIPKDVKIKSVNVKDHIAYVDFDKGIEGKIQGSCGEIMFTYSIVNTLTLNKSLNISGVKFYVDGNVVESLGGHLDHSEVMEPDLDLIKK